MLGADNSKVPGASFAGTFCHDTQPDGLNLLSNALWHRSQIFRVDPTIAIVLGGQSTVLPIRMNGGGMERFCNTNISVQND